MALGVGESLVSVLNEKGIPQAAKKVLNVPPASQIGPITDEARQNLIKNSPLHSAYSQVIDRESAFEVLVKRQKEAKLQEAKEEKEEEKTPKKKKSTRQGPWEAFFKSTLRAVGSQLGRRITRGILDSIKK